MALLRIKLRRAKPSMKFKNIKKEASSKGRPSGRKSPSNSRTIPDFVKTSSGKPALFRLSFPKLSPSKLLRVYRVALKIFIVIIFILAVAIVGLDLDANIKAKQEIDLEREKLTQELKFWENFISKHQDYKDAYFKLSILEYKLGDASKSKMYVEKGLTLDPNSQEGKKIEEFLGKSSTF